MTQSPPAYANHPAPDAPRHEWAAYWAGQGVALCAIPPGTKGPQTIDWPNHPLDPAHWLSHATEGMGALLGRSGKCSLDLDALPEARQALAAVGLALDDLTPGAVVIQGHPDRMRAMFCLPTGTAGLGTKKLTWPAREPGGKPLTVFELRGGAVQDCLPPTQHPGTKKPYRFLVAPWEVTWAELPAPLVELWRDWDRWQPLLEAACPWGPPPAEPPPPNRQAPPTAGPSVIDAFNDAHDPTSILAAHGYKPKGPDRWIAPSSGSGLAGVRRLPNTGRIYSHHASDLLSTGHAHDAFSLFATLEHGGDTRAAVKAAAKLLGMAQRPETAERPTVAAENGKPDPIMPPPPAALVATEEELAAARLTPRCIVHRHSYADVAQVVAPGGTGKTTLLIHEAVHIALGWPIWGLPVESPGWTLFVTAEDRREQIMARLREILASMNLDPAARAVAIQGVRVWDVTGEPVKLVAAADGNVILTALADRIVSAYTTDPPAVVIFDPLISFGASEGMVNDNEQGIVTAARRIVKGLNCCVRVVHHTGKGNARDGALDQYAGRGGSALPDGSRMTTVLQSWSPDSPGTRQPPPGCHPGPEASITLLNRAKLSYAPPNLPLIWVRREGYYFEHFTEQPPPAPEVRRANHADQIARFLEAELGQSRRHTANTLETAADSIGMTRKDVREALSELRVSGRLWDAPMPKALCQGSRKTYLAIRPNLAEDDGEVEPENAPLDDPTSPPTTTSPPYRESTSGEVVPDGTFPDSCNPAADDWRGSAKSAKYSESMVIPAPAEDVVEWVI